MNVNRRTFLTTSAAAVAGGALIIGVRLHGPFHLGRRPSLAQDPFDTWVRIYPNDRAELVLAKTEMGQGVFTALPMVLAEEAELDWTRISVVQAEECTGTGGSGSVIGSYMPLRQAGAQVREVMISAAAQQWNVSRQTCFAQKSSVIHRPSGRSVSYGSLVEQARGVPLPDAKKVRLKDPEEFTLLGRPLPHLDIPDKVLGRAQFGLDVRPAGLVYAVVARSPQLGGTLADFDARGALKVPGVLQVLEIQTRDGKRQVAVVARTTWAAIQGRDALTIRWSPASHPVESSEELTSRYRASFEQPPEWR
jgi:isoquinoline 1-oxidoreductase beta subunit